VLNALRHQRFGHSIWAWRLATERAVLNALRHQRFGHVLSYQVFGMMAKVLNALRHQRFGHARMLSDILASNACSTPYGIRGLGTRLPAALTPEI